MAKHTGTEPAACASRRPTPLPRRRGMRRMAKRCWDTPQKTARRGLTHAQAIRRAGGDDPSEPRLRRSQTDDLHEPFAEDQEMWEEQNQCMDEETQDPFGHMQHNLDKDLTTTSPTSEHSEPDEPPSKARTTAASPFAALRCSKSNWLCMPAPLACACRAWSFSLVSSLLYPV